MNKNKVISIVIISTLIILGAFYWFLFTDNKNVVYEGTYKNLPIVVKMITKEGFMKKTVYYSVQLGDLKPIAIDWNSTDSRGIPYDNSVFGKTKPIYIDTSYTYENELTFDSFNTITMLYISKKDFSLNEYLAYEDFFKNNWLAVQQELLNRKNGYWTHIVGVVYGDRTDFIKTFTGNFENKLVNLTITPDGEIILSNQSNSLEMQNSGLSNKVQMPGMVIIKKRNEASFSPNYTTFKDKNQKKITDYFNLVKL